MPLCSFLPDLTIEREPWNWKQVASFSLERVLPASCISLGLGFARGVGGFTESAPAGYLYGETSGSISHHRDSWHL